MTSSPEHILQQYFGFSHLRGGQGQVINSVLSGRSAAAIFPTGSGKSLCYQLPAIMLPHLTLVISPLLALMKDQLEFLQSKGIAAAAIDSTQDRAASQQIMADVKAGKIKILMVSVERLKNERFRHFIQQVPISLLVVDEAHCISEWGHNFRPDYLKLPEYQKAFNIPQTLLLTATATQDVIDDMAKKFAIDNQDVCVTGFYRSNLHLSVLPSACDQKFQSLASLLSGRNLTVSGQSEASIVYVTLQHTAEEIAHQLLGMGFNAKAYHAGLASEVREEIQQQFMTGQVNIIVATIAFGMGIDKSDIRHVIHYDLPKSIENYSQEIGRAGRDGNISNCTVLASEENLPVLENFVYGDTPELSSIVRVLDDIQRAYDASKNSYDCDWEFTFYQLSADSNIRQLPLKTLIVYLELKQMIASKLSYFAEYKFKLLVDESELLDQFQGERQQFLQAVLDHCKKGRIWYQIDFDAIYQNYHTEQHEGSRSRVITALEYIAEKQQLVLETKQMTEVYSILKWPQSQPEKDQLAQEIFQYFKQKEQSEIARIRNMIQLFKQPKCLSGQLAEYFADHQFLASHPNGCGHCSVCLNGGPPLQWPNVENHTIEQTLAAATQIRDLDHLNQSFIIPLSSSVQEKYQQPASAELIAKALCGIAAPWLTKVGARKLMGFGVFEEVRFESVLELVKGS